MTLKPLTQCISYISNKIVKQLFRKDSLTIWVFIFQKSLKEHDHCKCRTVAWRFWRAKDDWIGCCLVTVQKVKWLAKHYSLNHNFSFLNRILLLLISSSYSIVLMKLNELYFRSKVGIKFLTLTGIEPELPA